MRNVPLNSLMYNSLLGCRYTDAGCNVKCKRKAISAFLVPSPDLLLEDPVAGRPTPPWAPRRGTRSPDIDSGLVRGVFVRLRVRSCIVPKGIHEGWYPANTERHL